MKELDITLQNYLKETRALVELLKKHPKNYAGNLRYMSMTKDNSSILGYMQVYYLYKAVEDIYKALCDDKIVCSENLILLLSLVADKLEECCSLIETGAPELEKVDVKPYLLYCDKAVAGEIFDPNHLIRHTEAEKWLQHKLKASRTNRKNAQKKTQEIVSIPSEKISGLINYQEEMIARTYIINNQVAMLKSAIADKDMKGVEEAYKLLANDTQNLQSSLLIAHENFLGLIQDDSFLKDHQECQGFFVTANKTKY